MAVKATKTTKATKKKAAPKRKMGRPTKNIDKEQFEKLCGMQCTYEEICDWFDVTDKTLNAWCKKTYNATFSDVFRQKRNMGRISLRRSGYELAKHNPAVHIFYAKNFLGMTDKTEQQIAVISDETRASVNELLKFNIDAGAGNTNSNTDPE